MRDLRLLQVNGEDLPMLRTFRAGEIPFERRQITGTQLFFGCLIGVSMVSWHFCDIKTECSHSSESERLLNDPKLVHYFLLATFLILLSQYELEFSIRDHPH